MGISRLKRLMYKRMQFDSLIDLVKEFEESYKFYCHDLLVVEIGLPFSHHDISETPLLWKAVRFSLQDGNCLEDYKVAFTRLSNDLETVAFYYSMKIIEEGLFVANELEFGIVDGVISLVITAEIPSRK